MSWFVLSESDSFKCSQAPESAASVSRFSAEMISTNPSFIHCTEVNSISLDWLTLICLCNNSVAVKTEVWPQQLPAGLGGGGEVCNTNHNCTLKHLPLSHSLRGVMVRSAFNLLQLLIFLISNYTIKLYLFPSLFSPHSKSVSSLLFYKTDGSEVKHCQLRAPHLTCSSHGSHSNQSSLGNEEQRKQKKPRALVELCCATVSVSVSEIMICAKCWKICVDSERQNVWDLFQAFLFLPQWCKKLRSG